MVFALAFLGAFGSIKELDPHGLPGGTLRSALLILRLQFALTFSWLKGNFEP